MHAARVAVVAALLAAVLYVGVVVPFDILDAKHLVAQVDTHVADRLNRIASLRGEGGQVHGRLASDNDVDMAPVVIWRADRHGHTVPVTAGASPLLPKRLVSHRATIERGNPKWRVPASSGQDR